MKLRAGALPDDVTRTLEAADNENHKRGRDVEIGQSRMVLTSPNGTRHTITVTDAGLIVATPI